MASEKIESADEAWETRALGATETHAVVAATSEVTELKGMFGLAKKSVSIESMNPTLGLPSRPTASAVPEINPNNESSGAE